MTGSQPGTAEKPRVLQPGFVPNGFTVSIASYTTLDLRPKLNPNLSPIPLFLLKPRRKWKSGKVKTNIPFTISFNILGLAYKLGFRNPIGPFPFSIRSSLMRFMTDAKIGVDADVPPDVEKFPPL